MKICKQILGKLTAFLVTCAMIISLSVTMSFAEEVSTLDSDQTTPRDGNVMIQVTGTFSTMGKDAILKKINTIRWQACQAHDVNPNKIVTSNGKIDFDNSGTLSLATDTDVTNPTDEQLSQDNGDYHPLKWSAELEHIAEIRAVEANIKLSHQRPNSLKEGSNSMTVDDYGFNAAENLAWNYSDMETGINQWYQEREDAYLKTSTSSDTEYGHYTTMINPELDYIGMSCFTISEDDNGGSTLYPTSVSLEECEEPESGSYYSTNISYSNWVINTTSYTMKEKARNISGKYKMNVEVDANDITGLTIKGDSQLYENQSETLEVLAKYLPTIDNYGIQSHVTTSWTLSDDVTWSSSDETVATVDQNGKVTPKKVGQTTITATSSSKSASFNLSVTHEWDEGKVTKAANCHEKGTKTYTCKNCGETKTETTAIDSSNHTNIQTINAKAATCTTQGYTGDTVCLDCGATISSGSVTTALGHDWGEWATQSDGTLKRTCQRCGESEIKVASSTNDSSSTSTPSTSDQTSNTSTPSSSDQTSNTSTSSTTNNTTATSTTSISQVQKNMQALTNAIVSLKNDADPKGSNFSKLQLRSSKIYNNSIKVSWNSVKNAKTYMVYGNKCGSKYKYILSTTKTTYTQKKLKKGTYYKCLVVAVDANGKKLATSKVIHVATKGGSNANVKSLVLSKTKLTLKKNKSYQLKVKTKLDSKTLKTHRKIAYESSNTKVVTVSANGKITAKAKGKAKITVYAQNGLSKSVTVTIK